MKFYYSFFCLLAVLLFTSCSSNTTPEIEIIVKAYKVQPGESIYIAGNHLKLGNWAPDKIKLENVQDSIWSIKLPFNIGESIQFKFTRGGWDSEALTNDGRVSGNHTINVNADTTASFTITKWRDTDLIEASFDGQITGTLKYHKKIEYPGLRDRDIIVWLPPGYGENSKQRYPVLYMHDGQNIIDPQTSAFGIDWQVDETADSLISGGEIEPIIVVGIYNTADRSPEYSDTELGQKYVDLLINHIKPMIDKNYRTKPDRKNTAIAGSSMGGLISFILVWNHSDVFSKAICMSPAFAYREYNYVENIKSKPKPEEKIKIYIDNGGVGLEKLLQPGIDQMLSFLKDSGYENDKDLFVVIEEEAEHNEPAWAARMAYPLKIMFGK